MVAAFFGCSCFMACFGAGIITRPFSASRVTGNQLRQKKRPSRVTQRAPNTKVSPLPVAVRLRETVSLGPKTAK